MAKKTNQKKKKLQHFLPYIIAGALLLLIGCIILLGSGGPMTKLRQSAKKTLFADSFTTVFQLSVDQTQYDGILNAAIDPDKRELMFYLQLATNTTDYICGIYNNTFALCDASTNDLQVTDVKDRVTAFFDALEAGSQPDWELLLDFSEYDLHQTITRDLDMKLLTECVADLLSRLNDPDWAERYAGYSTDRKDGVKRYQFRPAPDVLAEQLLPIFQPAFLDPQRYAALEEYTDNAKYLLASGAADLTFGVKHGKLVSLELDLQYHNTSVQGSFEFIGINSTIVDYDTIAYFIDQAGKTPAERFEDQNFFEY